MSEKNIFAEKINREILIDAKRFITECENAYSTQVKAVVNNVCQKSGNSIIMLAGPSSSGKTTTAQLMKKSIEKLSRPSTVISLDDFYFDQVKMLYFEDGTPDFETINALDINYITECLTSLLKNGECMLPKFSFQTKKRSAELLQTQIEKDTVIIVEGLHAINPMITGHLDGEKLTKVYVSVSSRIVSEGEVLFTKRDLRFVRRMIRDYHHRNADVNYTFRLWKGVRMGEDRYLFPFRHLADVGINSVHPYEPCLFKKEAVRLLGSIDSDSVYYDTAKVIAEKFEFFEPIEEREIPENSLLREFLKGRDNFG